MHGTLSAHPGRGSPGNRDPAVVRCLKACLV